MKRSRRRDQWGDEMAIQSSGYLRNCALVWAAGAALAIGGCDKLTPNIESTLGKHEVAYLEKTRTSVLIAKQEKKSDGSETVQYLAANVANTPANVRQYMRAGFTKARTQCQAFFDRLTNAEQESNMLRQAIGLAQAGTLATAPLAGVSDTIIAALGASLGFSVGGIDAYRAIYIISPDTGPVYDLVVRAQDTFGNAALNDPPASISEAILQVQQYHDLCTTKQIRRMVSEAVTRGDANIRRAGAERFLTEQSLAQRQLLNKELTGVAVTPTDEAMVVLYWYIVTLPGQKGLGTIHGAMEKAVKERLSGLGYNPDSKEIITARTESCEFGKGKSASEIADRQKCLRIRGYLASIDVAENGRLSQRVAELSRRLLATARTEEEEAKKKSLLLAKTLLSAVETARHDIVVNSCTKGQEEVRELDVYEGMQNKITEVIDNQKIFPNGPQNKQAMIAINMQSPLGEMISKYGPESGRLDRHKALCTELSKNENKIDVDKVQETVPLKARSAAPTGSDSVPMVTLPVSLVPSGRGVTGITIR